MQMTLSTPAVAIAAATCPKCAGSGRFVSYAGRDCGPCFSCKGTGYTAAAKAGPAVDSGRLVAAFEAAARNGLAKPILRFDGFTASLAGEYSNNPGAVYLKAQSTYLGKIMDGVFSPSREAVNVAGIVAKVTAAMVDPLAAAIAYGRATGNCSCCGRKLTDPESVANGIGPVCATRFEL